MLQLPDTTTESGQREASVMLARLCGWEVKPDDYGEIWITCLGEPYATTNLYQPGFMSMAWRVLNWLHGHDKLSTEYMMWMIFCDYDPLESLPPADAQRAWLDKILSLAIGAGMIDVAADRVCEALKQLVSK